MTAKDRAVSEEAPSRSGRSRLILSGLMVFLAVCFTGLGIWQVQRLSWKLDLIARVEARVHRDAVPAPPASEWPDISAEKDEYRHVTVSGTFDHTKTVLVQAVTERGAGFWVMTPLMRNDGSTILINRGFVPADRRETVSRLAGASPGPISVTGLLRIGEPGGGFLRINDPAAGRWYSRDITAIARAQGLVNVAPYFIDADATPNAGGLPVGGLTVVSFRNSHLVYALTWFALAGMSLGACYLIHRRALA